MLYDQMNLALNQPHSPLDFPNRLCCPAQQMGNVRDHVDWPESEIRHATNRGS